MTQNKRSLSLSSEAEFKDACRLLTQSETCETLSKVIIDGLWHAVNSCLSPLHYLIEFSSEILATQEGGKLLWHTLGKGDLKTATELVLAGADLSVRKLDCHADMTFLHFLAQQMNSRGYYQLALLMIDKGADVNAIDYYGYSVLYYAISNESTDLTKALLQNGAEIDAYNESPSTCVLRLALEMSNAEYLLELLVYSEKDEAKRNGRAMYIAEFHIDDQADLVIIKRILDRGLPVNYVNPYGWTLLNRAIKWNRIDLIEFLLDNGAEVNKAPDLVWYPIFLAAMLEETSVTALLIKRGADIHVCNEDGEYAIHRACESQSAKNIQLLLQLGADINVKNKQDQTAFSMMNFEYYTVAELIVIRHLALLDAKTQNFNKKNILHMYFTTDIERFYNVCVKELEKMKMEKICDGVPYFYLVDKSLKELSRYVKNEEFVNNFNNKLRRTVGFFPQYFMQMKLKIKIAKKKEKLKSSTKKHVAEFFSDFLPCLVIDKIADYLCFDEWKNLEKNYYLQLRKIV